MATVDLGKIKQVFRGTYDNSATYAPDDLVAFTDGSVTSTYICLTATTGNAPSSGGTAHANWAYVAKGQATSPTTTQGDIIVRGASADGRLAIGAAGKALIVNSSGNGLEYGNGGLLLNHGYAVKTDVANTSSTSYVDIPGLSVTMTPASTSSRFFINYNVAFGIRSSKYSGGLRIVKVVGGTTTNDIYLGDAVGSRTRGSNFRWSDNASHSENNSESMSGTIIHHPNTTSAVTFKLQFNNGYSGGFYSYVNYSAGDNDNSNHYRVPSSITVLEFAQ